MNYELLLGMVVVCLSHQTFNVRAMECLCKRKTANILGLICPIYEIMMPFSSQCLHRLQVQHNMHSILHTESWAVAVDGVGEQCENIVILIIFLRGNNSMSEVEVDELGSLVPQLLSGRFFIVRKVVLVEISQHILDTSIPPVPIPSEDDLLEVLGLHCG